MTASHHNKMMKISPFNPSSPSLTAGPPSPRESGEKGVRKCGPGEGNLDTMEVVFLGVPHASEAGTTR
jgi:hypothetical protein